MPTKQNQINMGGMDLIVNRLITGKTSRAAGEITIPSTLDAGAMVSKRNVVNVTTDAAYTIDALESGTLFLLNKADGITFTLPTLSAANVGLWYEFQINTTITSGAAKWSTGAQGTDWFNGSLITADPDGSPAEATFVVTGNGSSHDNISMNGSTTGGVVGTCFRVLATSATTWTVFGVMAATGDTATPFATS